MITQELTNYVRGQLSAGVAREKIISKLLGEGGWTIEQINEVFQTVNHAGDARIQQTGHTDTSQSSNQDGRVAGNTKWTKVIPRLNIVFMIISALLVFGLDLMILIDNPGLAYFFYVMLAVLGIFIAFFLYENRALKRKFTNSESKLDSWFVALVVFRDLVFVLNFIPLIQILGGTALAFGGIPYLIGYYFMLRARNKSATLAV